MGKPIEMWQCRKKQWAKVLLLQACNVAVNATTFMNYAAMRRKSWLQIPRPKHPSDVDKCIIVVYEPMYNMVTNTISMAIMQ